MWLAFTVGLAAIVVASEAQAQGAGPGIITLSCDGKLKDLSFSDQTPEPVSNMGIVVNLSARSVAGFGDIVARIYKADDASISFSGEGTMTLPGANGTIMSVGSISVSGKGPAEIAAALGVSRMSVWRALKDEVHA
jgi:hypothetical protein